MERAGCRRADAPAHARRHHHQPDIPDRPGAEEILGSYRSLFTTFPDWQYIGEEPLVDGDGDRLAQQFVVHATHSAEFMGLPGSGRKFDIQGVRVLDMKEGLIAFERRYYDFTGLLIQLGVLRGKPAR